MKNSLALLSISAVLCASAAFAQTPVANVYVQTAKGVNVFNAAPNGRLTLVPGSPFNVTGQIAGFSGNYVISTGEDNVHVYPLASNGAIDGQVGEISTQDYNGKQCGTVAFATLDRTGQDLYVGVSGTQNENLETLCIAIQSFKISSTGKPSYLGTVIPYDDPSGSISVYNLQLVFSAGNTYAYAVVAGLDGGVCGEPVILAFQRETSGALELAGTQSIAYPQPEPGGWQYFPWRISPDNGNHISAELVPEINAPCGTRGSGQLATFTINSNGSIASTNTYQNMPSLATGTINGVTVGPVSPAGEILPVSLGNNLQIFQLNGASPATAITGQIPVKGLLDSMAWDSSGHLYGLNVATCMLRVWTVTSKGLAEDPGSPINISEAANLFVVSK